MSDLLQINQARQRWCAGRERKAAATFSPAAAWI